VTKVTQRPADDEFRRLSRHLKQSSRRSSGVLPCSFLVFTAQRHHSTVQN